MQLTDYDLLVLRAFEALRREIAEAEQYTINHHNALIEKQQAQAEAAGQAAKTAEPTATKTKGTK